MVLKQASVPNVGQGLNLPDICVAFVAAAAMGTANHLPQQ